MEDVDKIIISSIKEIGCDDIDGVQQLKDCSVNQIISMTVCCLKAINPDVKLPTALPFSVSAQFNTCAKVAQQCLDMGYKGEAGFHTFLYFNESDVRKILMFLVENLPREEVVQSVYEPKSVSEKIRLRIRDALKSTVLHSQEDNLQSPYSCSPFISEPVESGILVAGQKISCSPKEWKDFTKNVLPFVSDQVSSYENFLPSIITLNARGILYPDQMKHCRWNPPVSTAAVLDSASHSESVQVNEGDVEVTLHNSLSENDTKTRTSKQNVQLLKGKVTELRNSLLEVKKSRNSKKDNNSCMNNHRNIVKYSIQLLPDAENCTLKLVEANERYKSRMDHLISQWEEYSKPLMERHASLSSVKNKDVENRKSIIERINAIRTEVQATLEQVHRKTLLEEKFDNYNKNMKGTPRKEYTERILEIIKNIKKQGKGIDNILSDTRALQREINNLTEKIKRTYITTEHLIEEGGIDDDFSQEAYKLILILHSKCLAIVDYVTEVGTISREIKELEEQISEASSELTTEKVNQLSMDLQKIKIEQSFLRQQLQKVTFKKKTRGQVSYQV